MNYCFSSQWIAIDSPVHFVRNFESNTLKNDLVRSIPCKDTLCILYLQDVKTYDRIVIYLTTEEIWSVSELTCPVVKRQHHPLHVSLASHTQSLMLFILILMFVFWWENPFLARMALSVNSCQNVWNLHCRNIQFIWNWCRKSVLRITMKSFIKQKNWAIA